MALHLCTIPVCDRLTVEVLLQHKENPNLKSINGDGPLTYLATQGEEMDCLIWLWYMVLVNDLSLQAEYSLFPYCMLSFY